MYLYQPHHDDIENHRRQGIPGIGYNLHQNGAKAHCSVTSRYNPQEDSDHFHKVVPALMLEDTPKFLEAAKGTPYYTLFYLIIYTGLRCGKALALRWKNIDLWLPFLGVLGYLSVAETIYRLAGGYIVKEPKTPSSRCRIALSPSLVLVLRQYRIKREVQQALLRKPLTDNDFVFAHPDGSLLDPSTVSHALNKVIR